MKLRPTFLALALAASGLAWGEPPETAERVARLSYVEGVVQFDGVDESATSALPDRPLVPGDRLSTDYGGKAELALGTAVIRLDERSDLFIANLDETAVRTELTAGTASLHLRELLSDETFEISTPHATISFHATGEYRVDVASDDSTSVTVRNGAAEIATAAGTVRVADGQLVRLEERDGLATLAATEPADDFDDWVLEREARLAQEAPPPFEPNKDYEEEALDEYGEWYDDPGYGRVWMPSYAYGGYDPFDYGYWQSVGFGYAWYDPMPWSDYTFHYGRWAYLDHLDRWCWVPERRDHRRHAAPETHPFGRVRTASRLDDERHDSRFDNRLRQDEAVPVGRSSRPPRRVEVDWPPVSRREVDSGRKAEGRSSKTKRSSNNPSEWRSSLSSAMTRKSSRDSGARSLP